MMVTENKPTTSSSPEGSKKPSGGLSPSEKKCMCLICYCPNTIHKLVTSCALCALDKHPGELRQTNILAFNNNNDTSKGKSL